MGITGQKGLVLYAGGRIQSRGKVISTKIKKASRAISSHSVALPKKKKNKIKRKKKKKKS